MQMIILYNIEPVSGLIQANISFTQFSLQRGFQKLRNAREAGRGLFFVNCLTFSYLRGWGFKFFEISGYVIYESPLNASKSSEDVKEDT